MSLINSLWKSLPPEGKVAMSAVMFAGFTGAWLFIGDVSRDYSEFSPTADEQAKRARLPKPFLPLHPSGKLLSLEQIHRKRPFVAGTKTVTASFEMPVVASTVLEFYKISLAGDGWKMTSNKTDGDGSVIEVSKDKTTGTIVITREDAGSDLDLTVTVEE